MSICVETASRCLWDHLFDGEQLHSLKPRQQPSCCFKRLTAAFLYETPGNRTCFPGVVTSSFWLLWYGSIVHETQPNEGNLHPNVDASLFELLTLFFSLKSLAAAGRVCGTSGEM